MAKQEETFELFEVMAVGETQKAIRIQFGWLRAKTFWVPKSQITADSDVKKKGDEGTLAVTAWWARENRLLNT